MASGRFRRRWLTRTLLAVTLMLVLPILASFAGSSGGRDWRTASRESSGLSPDPATTQEAVVQVFAARTFGWRGALGVHTWIVTKPTGAAQFTRYEVIGWRAMRGAPALVIGHGTPDSYWFGSPPDLLVDLRGEGVDEIILQVVRAVAAYPHAEEYRMWPGPNSNTFTAHVGRMVPALGLHLPPTAIGKDYLAEGGLVGTSPSGTGLQLSLLGVLGLTLGLKEGVEVNVLGFTFGLDVVRPALKLPGVGRVGFPIDNGGRDGA